MGDKRNFAALDWVAGEIFDTLKEARQALEAYVEDPKDSTRIRFCLTHIHQVHGSLQMVEFHGAALLAEEMEQAAQAIMENEVSNIPEAQEVLMRGLLQLPIFIEYVKTKKDDNPAQVMPLLNDLRAVRKQSYLSETNLFSPDLSSIGKVTGEKHALLSDRQKLLQVLKKLREMYQFAAASVLRGIKVEENLTYLDKVFSRLELISQGTASFPIWEVSAALVDALKRDDVEFTVAVRGLLRYIARELRIVGEKAPAAFDIPPRESLLKNLLFYVARSEDGSDKVALVKQKYKLNGALMGANQDDSGAGSSDMLQAPDAEAIRSVVVALQDELTNVKRVLDISLSGTGSSADLKEVLPIVKRVSDTLAVLGIGDLRKQMIEQSERLEKISDANIIDEAELMQTASNIIDIEHRLRAIAKSAGRHDDLSQVDEREVEIDSAKAAVIKECASGLQRSKDAIIDYISYNWDKKHLENVGTILTEIRGGLNMIPLRRPAAIIASCSDFIQERLLGSENPPSFETQQSLADVFVSVEAYLERLMEDMYEDSDDMLDIAEEGVASLGYEIQMPVAVVDTDVSHEALPDVQEETMDQVEQAPVELTSQETLQTQVPETEQPEPIVQHRDDAVAQESAPVNEPEVIEQEQLDHAELPASAEQETPQQDIVEPEVATEDQAAAEPAQAEVAGEAEEEFESDIDEEIIEIFVEEVGEVLETLGEYFPQWRQKPTDQDSLVVVRRAFHTLKGSGRMVEAFDIGELAWSIENMLNRIIDHTIKAQAHVFNIIDAVIAIVPTLLNAFENRKVNPYKELTNQYEAWANSLAEGNLPEELAHPLPAFDTAKTSAADAAPAPQESEVSAEPEMVAAPEASEELQAADNEEPVSEAAADDEDSDFDGVLQEIFSQESISHLVTIEDFIRRMEQDAPLYSIPSDALQRALHTLKGSAKMAQIWPIAEITEPLEHFTKELITFQVRVDEDILQLIRDAVDYIRQGLGLIESGQPVLIPKVEQFVARTNELRELALGFLESGRAPTHTSQKKVDPRMLSLLMAEEMALLLEADQLLDRWQADGSCEGRCDESLKSMVKELSILEQGAQQANLLDMALLSRALNDSYKLALGNKIATGEEFFSLMHSGHESLLAMVDAVAAGQNVVAPPRSLTDAIDALIASAEDFAIVDEADAAAVEDEQINVDEEASTVVVEQDEEEVASVEAIGLVEEDADSVEETSFAEEEIDSVEDISLVEEGADAAEDISFVEEEAEVSEATYLVEQPDADSADDIETAPETLADEAIAEEPVIPALDNVAEVELIDLEAANSEPKDVAANYDTPASEDTELPQLLIDEEDGSEESLENFFSEDTLFEEPDSEQEPLAEDDTSIVVELTSEQDSPLIEETEISYELETESEDTLSEDVELIDIDPESQDFATVDVESISPEIAEASPIAEQSDISSSTPEAETSVSEPEPSASQQEEPSALEAEAYAPEQETSAPESESSTLEQESSTPEQEDQGNALEDSAPMSLGMELDGADDDISITGAVAAGLGASALSSLEPSIDSVDSDTPNIELMNESFDIGNEMAGMDLADISDDTSEPETQILEEINSDSDIEEVELSSEVESQSEPDELDQQADAPDLDAVATLEQPSIADDLETEDLELSFEGFEEPADTVTNVDSLELEDDILHEGMSAVDNSILTLEEEQAISEQDSLEDSVIVEDENATVEEAEAHPPIQEQAHEPSAETPAVEVAAELEGNVGVIPGLLDDIDSKSEDFDQDILEIFLEEAEELSEGLDEAIHAWQSNWSDSESLEEIKRILHTLKGGARLSGLTKFGDLTHDYESMLIDMGEDLSGVDQNFFNKIHGFQDKILSATRAVKTFIESDYDSAIGVAEEASTAPAPVTEADSNIEELPTLTEAVDLDHAEAGKPDPASDEPDTNNVVKFEPKTKPIPTTEPESHEFTMPTIGAGSGGGQQAAASVAIKKAGPQEVVKVSAELLEELVNLAGETSINRSRLEQYVNDFGFALEEVDSTLSRLQDQLRRLDIETEAQILFRQEQMEAHDEFDPLEMDRYSHLQQLSRSLIESASDLTDLKTDLGDKLRVTETLLLQQSRINTTLQEGLMRSRMVPFSRMVPRLRRIVRQVSAELGKNVSFELDNVEGELDRSVLERMVPPFEHMLRNAVDHGIESPEERLAAGKTESGRIVLTLAREGGDVIIRLADDGRGVDLKRVKEKAIERELMAPDAQLSDYDIMQFILHAGFSTAENVTQISGRGVGMDVVSAEIKQLGGSVKINSSWGKGTEFIIRLPFTLSVNRALMVEIGKDHYAVPLSSIEGIVRVSPFELEHYYASPEAQFEYANENYHVRYLGSLLYAGSKPVLEGHVLPLPVMLVRSAEHTMALQVDAVLGSREIVVKSLGQQFSSVPGLSGATVMGDGSVVVILDPHALVRQEIAQASLQIEEEKAEALVEVQEESGTRKIMVVDDSVTVRKVTTRFLEREGFEVITAKDGVDALRLLQEGLPDLMLLDIEMPRMDGFEVAKTVRTTKRWEGLPIIMITSRTGDKHREHALSLGVNNYLGKPYQEDILLEAISEILDKKSGQK